MTTLARDGLLEAELAERLPAMVRFRNLLVHRYCSLDAERVWWAVSENLGGLRLFAAAVERFLVGDFRPNRKQP